MSEPILHLEEVATLIADLLKQVRSNKRELKLLKRTGELEIGEAPEDVGGSFGGGTGSEFLTPIVRVTSVTTLTTPGIFMGKRQRPFDGIAGWEDDSDFASDLEVTFSTNIAPPEVDDILAVRFTGNFQRFTAGNTLTLPRYGSFASVGVTRARLLSNRTDGNLLDCLLINKDGTEITTIVVARPDDLQTVFYDGTVQEGVTLTFVNTNTRTAVDGVNPDETHKITPSYINSVSILKVVRLDRGTGQTVGGVTVLWQDVTPGRQWAVSP